MQNTIETDETPILAAEPFNTAEEAWFWTCDALRARRDGTSGNGTGRRRPCDPDDIIKCLDGLYRRRRIDLDHARVLRFWGERRSRPDPRIAKQHGAAVLWRQALERLEWPLRRKGILREDPHVFYP